MKRKLPPSIRVFISSTFRDMQNERNYLATVVSPKLTKLCRDRGVSFFSVDLRWGITEEEQMNGEVLPICLREIDRCRPFFIGIIGNRYGSTLDEVSDSLSENIPWLRGKEGRSVTELEMLYGVLDKEQNESVPHSAFYFRSPTAAFAPECDEDEVKLARLEALKSAAMAADGVITYEYETLESFGEHVIATFADWLEKEFPTAGSVREQRRDWYNGELLRDYFDNGAVASFLDNYVHSADRTLVIHGEGMRGKTSQLTAWQPSVGKRILINCASDESYRYWPAIAAEIIDELGGLDENVAQSARDIFGEGLIGEGSYFFPSKKEKEGFREKFVNWLKKVKLSEQITIIINDLNLLSDNDGKYLSWLPSTVSESVNVIISTADSEILENADTLGYNDYEMPLLGTEAAETLLGAYLGNYGKSLSALQRESLMRSPLITYPGYLKYVGKFLIVNGSFENLDRLTADIGRFTEASELYEYTVAYMLEGYGDEHREALSLVIFILFNTDVGLPEEELYAIVSELTGISPIVWAQIRVVLEQLEAAGGDLWRLDNRSLARLATLSSLSREEVLSLMARHSLVRMRESLSSGAPLEKSVAHATSALKCFARAENYDALTECLFDADILGLLLRIDLDLIRSCWMLLVIRCDGTPELLLDLLSRIAKGEYGESVPCELAASLIWDLGLSTVSNSAKEILGKESQRILRRAANQSEDKVGKAIYALSELAERRDYRKVPELGKRVIEQYKLTDADKCEIYVRMAEAELKLDNYERAVVDCSDYCMSAIRAADTYHVLSSSMLYGEVLYHTGEVEAAKKRLNNAKRIALSLGALTEYISIERLLALCYSSYEEFDKAIAVYRKCEEIALKTGDFRRYASLMVDRCDAEITAGDAQGAHKTLTELYERVGPKTGNDYLIVAVKLLAAKAYAEVALGRLDDAEQSCLTATAFAKGTYAEQSLGVVYERLLVIYDEKKLHKKRTDVYNEYIQYLFDNGRYRKVSQYASAQVDQLQRANYSELAEKMRRKWVALLDSTEESRKYFDSLNKSGIDRVAIDSIREDIKVARSDSDSHRCAELLLSLAIELGMKDSDEALSALSECADLAALTGDTELVERALARAALHILGPRKNTVSESSFEPFMRHLNSDKKEVIAIWQELRVHSKQHGRYTESGECIANVRRLIELADAERGLVIACVRMTADTFVYVLDLDTSLALCELSDSCEGEIRDSIVQAILRDGEGEIDYLRSTYTGKKADEIVAFYERAVVMLRALKSNDAATLSGNIALIFRRRGDKEKTYRYHELSRDLYAEQGRPYDSYIEILNLASAHKAFGELEMGVNLLRETLSQSGLDAFPDLRASVAGNIAAELVRTPSLATDDSEVVECFEIEETYFREAEESRELAISLMNQIKYYIGLGKKDVAKEKYEEFAGIVEEYDIKEFRYNLTLLGQFFGAKSCPSNSKSGSTNASKGGTGFTFGKGKPSTDSAPEPVSAPDSGQKRGFTFGKGRPSTDSAPEPASTPDSGQKHGFTFGKGRPSIDSAPTPVSEEPQSTSAPAGAPDSGQKRGFTFGKGKPSTDSAPTPVSEEPQSTSAPAGAPDSGQKRGFTFGKGKPSTDSAPTPVSEEPQSTSAPAGAPDSGQKRGFTFGKGRPSTDSAPTPVSEEPQSTSAPASDGPHDDNVDIFSLSPREIADRIASMDVFFTVGGVQKDDESIAHLLASPSNPAVKIAINKHIIVEPGAEQPIKILYFTQTPNPSPQLQAAFTQYADAWSRQGGYTLTYDSAQNVTMAMIFDRLENIRALISEQHERSKWFIFDAYALEQIACGEWDADEALRVKLKTMDTLSKG